MTDKFDTTLKELKDELIPLFFEGLGETGNSIFDTSRIWEIERKLNLDDNSFQLELFEQLEDQFNCHISSMSTDMGSFVVLHNNWKFDKNGNCNKIEQPINEDRGLDELFENRTFVID